MTRKYMSITEFREIGLLQEINRRFLHPMGMALAIAVDSDGGNEHLSGIWDSREDPEGIYFAEDVLDPAKRDRVDALFNAKKEAREKVLGYHIQEIP